MAWSVSRLAQELDGLRGAFDSALALARARCAPHHRAADTDKWEPWGPLAAARAWLDAFHLALVCRQQHRLERLPQVCLETLRKDESVDCGTSWPSARD